MNTQYQHAIRAANAGETWPCPRCLHPTGDFPALSRRDNATAVCSRCGTEEAMRQFSGLAAWPTDDKWPFMSSSEFGGQR
jgi:transcription elongation factor Elf1